MNRAVRVGAWIVPLGGTLALLLAAATSAGAATITVPGDQPTIQDGLDAAQPGDTVLVSAGTYFENELSFGGKAVLLTSVAGPAATIIDGSDAEPVFRLGSGTTRGTIIDGFTIRNGQGTGNDGGGINIVAGSPTIRGNIIISNDSDNNGAGVKVGSGGNPLIQDNEIRDNVSGGKGGGIQVIASSAEILDNTIVDNTATVSSTSAGGGINLTGNVGTTFIIGNHIEGNSSNFTGGGIGANSSDVEIVDNVIIDNEAEFGGGVHVESNTDNKSWLIENNQITGNRATIDGGGLNIFANTSASTAQVLSNEISDNTCLNPTVCLTGGEVECCQGGAIRTSGGTGDQLFMGNTLSNNHADFYGGALLLAGVTVKSVVFEGNTVELNKSEWNIAGVACIGLTDCAIQGNLFLDNANDVFPAGRDNPGALVVQDCTTSTVENNFFRGNTGRLAGAVLVKSTGPAVSSVVRHNTFTDNTTTSGFDGTLRVDVDTTIANNVFDGDRRGIKTKDSPTVSISNNDFFDFTDGVFDSDAVEHTTVAGLNGESFASGNVELDPEPVDDLDYHLRPSSLLIAAALCSQTPGVDLDGEVRSQADGCDIGADEFSAAFGLFADGFDSGNTNAWPGRKPD